MNKAWWKSKTLWFNAIVGVLAAVEANAHLVQAYVPGSIYGWGMLLLTSGNSVLRLVTAQGVGLTDQGRAE